MALKDFWVSVAKPNESPVYSYDLSRAICQAVLFSLDDADNEFLFPFLPSFLLSLFLSWVGTAPFQGEFNLSRETFHP